MLHQARQTVVRQDTQAPGDRGCSRAAPGKGNDGEARGTPRTKPSKRSATAEGDLGVSAEERSEEASRRYRENSNHDQSLRLAGTTVIL